MSYTVSIVRLNESEPLPTKQLDGQFASVIEAWDAGTAEVLAYQLWSIETAFQVLDANGQIVEVTAKQVKEQRAQAPARSVDQECTETLSSLATVIIDAQVSACSGMPSRSRATRMQASRSPGTRTLPPSAAGRAARTYAA